MNVYIDQSMGLLGFFTKQTYFYLVFNLKQRDCLLLLLLCAMNEANCQFIFQGCMRM